MPYRPLLVVLLVVLAGCGGQMPDFLGRGGSGGGSYSIRPEPPTDPVLVPMRMARAERGLGGFIVRAEVLAPTQGFYGAELAAVGGGVPDANGVLHYELVARPPTGPQAVGPERTRELRAGIFVPNRALRQMSAVRITGSNTAQTLSLR